MVNDTKARQSEGFDFYDYRAQPFNALAGAESSYLVGVAQNAALQGAWPCESALYGQSALTANVAVGAAAVPVANVTVFTALQPAYIMDALGVEVTVIAAIIPVILPAGILVLAGALTRAYNLAQGARITQYLPVDSQETEFHSDQPCLIRLVNRVLHAQQLGAILPQGGPVQIALAAGVYMTVRDKWYVLYVVGSGAAGTLRIKSSG